MPHTDRTSRLREAFLNAQRGRQRTRQPVPAPAVPSAPLRSREISQQATLPITPDSPRPVRQPSAPRRSRGSLPNTRDRTRAIAGTPGRDTTRAIDNTLEPAVLRGGPPPLPIRLLIDVASRRARGGKGAKKRSIVRY